jgi:ubiquinone biosynthesis monooxygenase Coq7
MKVTTDLSSRPASSKQKEIIERFIRVDHAGEYGAKRIYEGQLAILGDTEDGDTIRHMKEQEEVHLSTFENLLVEREIRPTALYPIWQIAGFALGVGTALMGPKAAMACTVAVEEVIDEHYAAQSETLDESDKKQ